MNDEPTALARWRAVARSLARALRPTARIRLLGRPYRVDFASRKAWTERDHAFLQRLAAGERLVFDVGANQGVVALLMARDLAPDGRLVAFEPSQEACRLIAANAALNGLSQRIEVVEALVAERSGRVAPYYAHDASVFASMVANPFAERGLSVSPLVKATLALDDYAAATARRPSLVKIDVEGAEALVLAGMARLLAQARPTVYVEVHAIGGAVRENAARLLALLDTPAYRMVRLSTRRVVQDPAEFGDAMNRAFVLLLPQERPAPAWLAATDTAGL